MVILADSQITNASITGSNSFSYAGAENLKTYTLARKYITAFGETQIVIDFGLQSIDVDTIALCGTNLSSGATINLSYSDIDPETPEATLPLPIFTSFNQVWLQPSTLTKRYWVIDINDPNPQDSSGVEIGFIYIGKRTDSYSVVFPHEPVLNIASNPSLTATGQGYGSKGYVGRSIDFNIDTDLAGVEVLFQIAREKQNIDPVLLIMFEESLDKSFYPPMFGALTSDSYSYPMDEVPFRYLIGCGFSERF